MASPRKRRSSAVAKAKANARAYSLGAHTGVIKLAPSVLAHRAAQVRALLPAAWYRYRLGITGSSAVSEWADQSGHGRHLAQATANLRPTRQGDGSILFDGVAQYLRSPVFQLDQPCSLFCLLMQVTFTSLDCIFGMGAGSFLARQVADAGQRLSMISGGSPLTALGPVIAVGAYGVLGCTFRDPDSIISTNFVETTGPTGSTNPDVGLTLGADTGLANFSNIQFKEVIVFPAALTAAQRVQVITYLKLVGGI